ncbi:TetR/AcrR family transcriptional regulator [Streptomyces fuscichromogenes]|uniref:Transcriptional regulatory protein TetR n=1 Tax=Streptomyces fuscichromogenes TaxID=1324013 RepID=A0A918CTR5_9ACTN|nr:TetR/AcrR family transcriptional regulator [Streptomyces fuscichromogenes]GGN23019.1 putative transcriptional regulatory protein TetR [Streptomyces fuscichromogenes]
MSANLESVKPLRADARRNRARVLDTAHEVFAAEGFGVPIDEIARRAGVGAGTVYRHFPTKEALFEAVVLDRLDRLVASAPDLAAAHEPGEAFFAFLWASVDEGAGDKGLAEAMAGAGYDIAVLAPEAEQRFRNAFGDLLTRAQAAGAVRAGLTVDDVKALLVGCMAMQRYRSGEAGGLGLLREVVQDGLRGGRN